MQVVGGRGPIEAVWITLSCQTREVFFEASRCKWMISQRDTAVTPGRFIALGARWVQRRSFIPLVHFIDHL